MRLLTTIEPLDGSDLVALAQCMALDATAFPHASVPPVSRAGDPRVWVARAESRGSVIGFIATVRRAGALEVAGLAVDAAHRQAGVGRALVRVVIEAARTRGHPRLTLHVSTENEAALGLYESEGFVLARLLRRYYSPAHFGNGGDAFEMILRFRGKDQVSARRPRS